MRVARMRYSFVLDIPIPDDPEYDAEFDIDENHCLNTGRPGVAFEAFVRWHGDRSTCWACGLVDQEWLGVHEVERPYWADEMGDWVPAEVSNG